MINKLSHVTVFVTNHDEAHKFYVDKLGLDLRSDVVMNGGFRWLTVGPKRQADLEIVLMEIKPGFMWDEATAKQIQELVRKGAFTVGVLEADDCRKTYEELRKKGVEFKSPPTERPYGIEAIIKDPFGNLFSLTQHTK